MDGPRVKLEESEQLLDGQKHRMVITNSAVIQGNFFKHENRSDFDYISVRVISGLENFPADYNGVSGGGIWYQQFTTTDGLNFLIHPILAGVACWQSSEKKYRSWKERRITGHGWRSIYYHVPEAIAAK